MSEGIRGLNRLLSATKRYEHLFTRFLTLVTSLKYQNPRVTLGNHTIAGRGLDLLECVGGS